MISNLSGGMPVCHCASAGGMKPATASWNSRISRAALASRAAGRTRPNPCPQAIVPGMNLRISRPLASMPSGSGAPSKPADLRYCSSACTAGVHGPAGRRTVSPTRTTPALTFPPVSGCSSAIAQIELLSRRNAPDPGRQCGHGPLSEGKGGGPGPVPSGGPLSHQGDGGGAGPDGQVDLDRVLGGAKVVDGMSVADRQVGNDILELALERRERREGAKDVPGEGAEGPRSRAGRARARRHRTSRCGSAGT
jgi:hypothetical protein